MKCTYVNTQAVNENNKSIKNTAFNIDFDRFENIDAKGFNTLEPNRFFVIEDGKVKKTRKKKEHKEDLIENNRNITSFKKLNLENKSKFNVGTVLILSKPHAYFYHRKPIDVKKRYVFDVLNEKFILVKYEDYKNIGLNRHRRGSIIELTEKGWVVVNKDVKFPENLSEIKAHEIIEDVTENLLFWKSKDNVAKKCNKCKQSCKQLSIVSVDFCKNFDPIVPRKQRKKKKIGNFDDFQREMDGLKSTGDLLKDEVKKRLSK